MLFGMKKDRIGLNRVDSAPIVSNRIESARFGSTRITFTRKQVSRLYKNSKIPIPIPKRSFLNTSDLNFHLQSMDSFLFLNTKFSEESSNVFFPISKISPLVNPNLKLSIFFEQFI